MLVLDEPTNDLDVETLEVLEERLCEFAGTLLVVSHDREFLDNVVTSILVFERSGKIEHFVGGYSDWAKRGRELAEREQRKAAKIERVAEASQASNATKSAAQANPKAGKLSYKLKYELEQLPAQIDALEQAITQLNEESAAPGFYQRPLQEVQDVLQSLTEQQAQLDALIERWSELEDLNSA